MEGVGDERVELHPEAQPASNTPWLITRVATGLLMLISEYGWPCLLLGLLAVWLWRCYGHKWHKWQQQRQEQKEAAFYHKNPDVLLQREAAIESARLRMQQQLDEASRAHAIKMKLRSVPPYSVIMSSACYPDVLLQREAAIESARLRMQQQLDEASRAHAIKMKLREEEKRKERLAKQDGGHTLRTPPSGASTSADTCSLRPKGTGDSSKKKPSLRPEYNPLLGGGSFAGYRPPRRGGAAGGG
ncbi:Selenoprotein S [Trinorchestia longiramus]|nr:Selenoprotein S [Trinorchestia longiramus]